MSASLQSPSATRSSSEDFGLMLLNTRVEIRRSAAEGATPVSLQEHWMPFGESPPLHRHEAEDEVFHILEGVIRFRVGDTETVARAGDTLVSPKGVPHTFRVESPEGAHCLVMTPGADFESFVREVSRPALSRDLPVPAEPSPEAQKALAEAGLRHRIEILGPPLV